MTDQHTPTPWRAIQGGLADILGPDGKHLFRSVRRDIAGVEYAEQQENAALIVRAVNSYEATEELVTLMRREHPDGSVHFDSCCDGSKCSRFCELGRAVALALGDSTARAGEPAAGGTERRAR